MPPDERAWMLAHVRKKYPTAKIKGAELDLEKASWVLSLEINCNSPASNTLPKTA